MLETNTRISVLSDILINTAHLCLWKFSAQFELLETNCPYTDMFQMLFSSQGYPERFSEHFSESSEPAVLSDTFGFVWLAAAEMEDNILQSVYVLGPNFTEELTEKSFENGIDFKNFHLPSQKDFLSKLQSVPVLDYDTFIRYGIMLHYCITGQTISKPEISLSQTNTQQLNNNVKRWQKREFHGTWHLEQTMLKLIEDGNLNYDKLIRSGKTNGKVGRMSSGDPLRQVKNAIIVQTTLATRAAIRGGLTPELAYSISDVYIQKIEECRNAGAVYVISREMIHDFIQRVHKIKETPEYSRLTFACIDYVNLHITEKITIADIAGHLGYADYYLTTRFRKETGENLRDYISRQKIEQAKLLLGSTGLNVQDIADQLSFSNASYFGAVFRKFTGMTPNEYRISVSGIPSQ